MRTLTVLLLALCAAAVAVSAKAQEITEFAVPAAIRGPAGITTGPDGNLWFTEVDGNKIGKVTTGGVFTE